MSKNKDNINGGLNRSLSSGQMEMIALGGTIGVGLFMGSTSTIKWTGPSVLLAYAVVGILLYAVMRALGEMIYITPGTGSFADYATNYIHPLAGYLTKWSNIFQYIVVGISEVIAVTQYLNFWWPLFRLDFRIGGCRNIDFSKSCICQGIWDIGILFCNDKSCYDYLNDNYWINGYLPWIRK